MTICHQAMIIVLTDIHSITPSMGSVRGGTLITVTGTGFEVDGTNDIALDIDGIPCRVSLFFASCTFIRPLALC